MYELFDNIFLTILITTSIKATIYLFNYNKFTKVSYETEAQIISIKTSRSVVNKNATIPIISFITFVNKEVSGRPLLSWLYPINGYLFQKECIVFFDKNRPSKFIIKSNVEFVSNVIVIILTIVVIAYLCVS